MFQKHVRVKSQHQLKNSDKKLLKEQFKYFFSRIGNSELDEIFPKKETVLMIKVELALNNTAVVYVVNKKPIAFWFQETLFPTIFLLWQYPDIIPEFSTHDGVVQKLKDGAHLMLPGLLHPTAAKLITRFDVNCPVYINLATNKAAVAVGVTAVSSDRICEGCTRGRCVTIYHVLGDKLCSLENYDYPPLPHLGLPEWVPPKSRDLSEIRSTDAFNMEALSSNDALQAVTTEEELDEDLDFPFCPVMSYYIHDCNEETTETTEVSPHDKNEVQAQDVDKNTAREMDELLYQALITTIKYTKNLALPIPASTFYKMYMIPACPTGKCLDVKQSSYKKLGQFLTTMMEFGIVKTEELKKGVTWVTFVNSEHPCVRAFYLQPEQRPSKATNTEELIAPLIVEEGYSVTAKVLPIFSHFGFRKGQTIKNSDIRSYVVEYVKKQNLQDKENQNIINLDNALRDVQAAQSQVSWQILMENVCKAMSPYFKVVRGDNEMLHKGKLQLINISVAKRSGNKKVTLVDNLELYGINAEDVVSQCQKGVAASTTLNKTAKGYQLQVQGNQVTFIYELLTGKYNVPKKYIKGLELAPKKRK